MRWLVLLAARPVILPLRVEPNTSMDAPGAAFIGTATRAGNLQIGKGAMAGAPTQDRARALRFADIGEAKVCLVTTMVTGRVIVPRITITPGSARRCVITSNANLDISSPRGVAVRGYPGRDTMLVSTR